MTTKTFQLISNWMWKSGDGESLKNIYINFSLSVSANFLKSIECNKVKKMIKYKSFRALECQLTLTRHKLFFCCYVITNFLQQATIFRSLFELFILLSFKENRRIILNFVEEKKIVCLYSVGVNWAWRG